ncbi:MAG TPA: O-antigen ligase family protein, partial [Verrucomicrobiae bacterium]|nr:O-antigen ligase family protein [Verrucomicrobiae bacterium]
MTRTSAAAHSRKLTVALLCCLPFLAPFGGASRNADLQGIVLLLAGAIGWTAIILRPDGMTKSLRSGMGVLLAIFLLSCALSAAVNPHLAYDLWGAPYVRLGAAGFFACAGCGLALRQVPAKQFSTWLFVIILMLAIVAAPYTRWHAHSLARIGGLFSQADIFAVFLSCGLLLSLQMREYYRDLRAYILASQVLFFGLLLLSGTRFALLTVLVLMPIYLQQLRGWWGAGRWLLYLAVVVILLVALRGALPARVTNVGYADESIHYRLDLQSAAMRSAVHRPVAGYGPGNLADALDCRKLAAADLQATCRQHYFFNSSHNIYLDRVLAVGWLGGLAFLGLVTLGAYRNLRGG